MRYTIEGMNQSQLVALQLDMNDVMIIRFLIDFMASGKMTFRYITNVVDGYTNRFHWISYSKIIEDLPILGITTKDAIGKRFKKYKDCGLMELWQEKHSKTGTRIFFRFLPDAYLPLFNSDPIQNTDQGPDPKHGSDNNTNSYSHTNISLSYDNDAVSSKKAIAIAEKQSLDATWNQLIDEWNKATGQSQTDDPKMRGYFYGKCKKFGTENVIKAYRNYANSKWHRDNNQWRFSKMLTDPSMVGEWINKDDSGQSTTAKITRQVLEEPNPFADLFPDRREL